MKKKIITLLLLVIFCTGCQTEGTTVTPGNMTSTPDVTEHDNVKDQNEKTDDMTPGMIVSVQIGGETYNVDKDTNPAANIFFRNAGKEELKFEMSDYSGFEKNASLPWELPTDSDENLTAKPGDIVLYQGKTLAILYKENTAQYTRIGSISETLDVMETLFKKLKDDKDVDVKFMVEYTE